MNDILITTPIYYTNGEPHIGHAYTSIAADVLARHHYLKDNNVIFSTGTDEHGLKIQRAAEEKGVPPQDFVNDLSASFFSILGPLDISATDFIRTTHKRHKETVTKIWNILQERGFIYLDTYSGWYSVSDEAYVDEKDTYIQHGKRYSNDGALVEWFEQESYFFAFKKIKSKLIQCYIDNPDIIQPESARKQIYNIIAKQTDISISRTMFDWGIPVPNDPKHVIYVWLDALTNYLTVSGWVGSDEFQSFWSNSHHIIGKDIAKFHAVYWPAFLLAAGIDAPHRIHIHGWWTNDGVKMSKSKGNVIDPLQVVEDTDADSFRYFLLKAMPFGNDGDFSQAQMATICNAGLANGIGNLCQRTLTMLYKNYNGISVYTSDMNDVRLLGKETFNKVIEYNDSCRFQAALESIGALGSEMDKLIDKEAPWALVKSADTADQDRAKDVLYHVADTIKKIAILLLPYIPTKATEILNQLGVAQSARNYQNYNLPLHYGVVLQKPTPIFKVL